MKEHDSEDPVDFPIFAFDALDAFSGYSGWAGLIFDIIVGLLCFFANRKRKNYNRKDSYWSKKKDL